MRRRTLSVVVSLLAAAALGGCLYSIGPLITSDTAITPLAEGVYERCSETAAGARFSCEPVLAVLDAQKRYHFVTTSDKATSITLGQAGPGLTIVQTNDGGGHTYALQQRVADGWIALTPKCEAMPTAVKETFVAGAVLTVDRDKCVFSDLAALSDYLRQVSRAPPGAMTSLVEDADYESLRPLGAAGPEAFLNRAEQDFTKALQDERFETAINIAALQRRRPIDEARARAMRQRLASEIGRIDAWAAAAGESDERGRAGPDERLGSGPGRATRERRAPQILARGRGQTTGSETPDLRRKLCGVLGRARRGPLPGHRDD